MLGFLKKWKKIVVTCVCLVAVVELNAEALDAGIDAHIAKPVDMGKLNEDNNYSCFIIKLQYLQMFGNRF